MSKAQLLRRIAELEKQRRAELEFLNLPTDTQKKIMGAVAACQILDINPADLFQGVIDEAQARMDYDKLVP